MTLRTHMRHLRARHHVRLPAYRPAPAYKPTCRCPHCIAHFEYECLTASAYHHALLASEAE